MEPESNNFGILLKNAKNLKNVQCVQAGLWYKDTFLKVGVTPLSSGTVGFVVNECLEKDPEAIKSLSIDSLMDFYGFDRIDILKMDIEGSEYDIFAESRYKTWIDKVKILMIEFHEDYHRGITEEVTKMLMAEGFAHKKVSENDIYYREGTLMKD